MNCNCVVLGDINIDYVTDLSQVPLQMIDNACINAPILSYVGGNGTFFAEAAKEAGFNDVKLIASLGEDEAADTAKLYFGKSNINLINFPSHQATGKVIILYQPNDKRILIADRGANKKLFLSPGHSLSNYILTPTDLLYISGYTLLNDISNISLSDVIKKYKSNDVFIVIDAVPHEIFQNYSWDEYVYYCQGIDGIVIERETALGFMTPKSSKYIIDEIADFLLNSFNFCIVRLNSKSDFLIANKINRRVICIHYQPRVASLRFTDRVIAQIILRYICDPKDIFFNSEWIDSINNVIGGAK